MNSGINLIGKKEDPRTLEIKRRIRLLRLTALSVLSIVALISGVLFVVIAASPLPSLREQEEEIFVSLTTDNAKIQRLLFVDKQLDHIQSVLTSRSKVSETLEAVLGSAPLGVQIISYNLTQESMDMTIRSTSLSEIEAYLQRVSDAAVNEEIFPNVIVSDFDVNTTAGLYQVHISMTK